MIVNFLKDKYRCGSNLGYSAVKKKNLLKDLNSIIEWDFCVYPKKLKEGGDAQKEEDWIEDKEFFGKGAERKLVPGNMFVFDGQVIAVDNEEQLVLCVTETGYYALQRFYDSFVMSEVKLNNNNTAEDFCFSEIDVLDDKKFDKEFSVPYYLMKIWRDKVQKTRWNKDKGLLIKTEFIPKDFIYPIELVIKDWKVCYNSEDVPDDMIEDTSIEMLSWFWNNTVRIK